MMQAIMTGVWTKLQDHDVELIRIVTTPPDAKCELRPVGGIYPRGWRVPIAGWYRFGYRDDRYETTTRVELPRGVIVLADARQLDTLDGGAAYTGPEIGTNSGQRLMTGNWKHGLKVDWREP